MHKQMKKIQKTLAKAEKDTSKLIKKDVVMDKKIETCAHVMKRMKKDKKK